MVDLIFVGILAFCVLRGYLRGAASSLLGFAALVVAYVASGPLGPVAAKMLMAWAGLSAGTAYTLGRIIAGLCIYVPLLIVASVLGASLRRTKLAGVRVLNSALGALIGLAWGLLAVLILVFLVDVGLKVFPEASGRIAQSARASFVRRWVSSRNPADRFLITDVLRLVRVADDSPEVLDRLSQHEHMQELLDHPKFQKVLADKELVTALRQGGVDAVLRNENLRELVADKELRALILSPETRSAVQEAIRESE